MRGKPLLASREKGVPMRPVIIRGVEENVPHERSCTVLKTGVLQPAPRRLAQLRVGRKHSDQS